MAPLVWRKAEIEGRQKRRPHLVIADLVKDDETISIDDIAAIMESRGYDLGIMTVVAIRQEIRKGKKTKSQ